LAIRRQHLVRELGYVDREQLGHSDLGWFMPIDDQKGSRMTETVDVQASASWE